MPDRGGPAPQITHGGGPGIKTFLAALAITSALALGAAPAAAQDATVPTAVAVASTDTLRLAVDTAVERALVTNEVARIARAGVDRTEGIVREAYARAMPAIDGSWRYARNLQRPVIFFNQEGETQQITIGDANEHAFGITLEQPIFDRSLGAGVRAARHGLAASEDVYEHALVDVAFDARLAYYDALLAQANVRARDNAVRLAEARFRQVTIFHDVGTASDFDLLTAEVGVENERPELIRARNELSLALSRLRRVSGLPLDAPLLLVDSLAYVPLALSLDDALARAVERRADLAAARERVDLSEQLVAVERAEAFPTLSLELDVSRRASSTEVVPDDRDFSQSASAALALRFPIFDGRRVQGRTLQARADLVIAEEQLRALERDVRVQTLDAWQSVQAAGEAVEATAATAALARRAYDIAVVRYRSGLSTQLELDEAEQDVFVAESNAAEALWSHMAARALLARAMGER